MDSRRCIGERVLDLAGAKVKVYVLEDGTRLLDAEDLKEIEKTLMEGKDG